MGKQSFNTITEDELKEANAHQQSLNWTFNNERELAESAYYNRFNFLLLAYSLFLNAYFMAKDSIDKLTVLIIGLLITLLLSIGIVRAYIRYRMLVKISLCIDDKNVVSIIDKEGNSNIVYKFLPNSITNGYIVPIVMLLSFIVGIVYNRL